MNDKEEYIMNADACGNLLDGGNCYKFHLPQDIPVCNFWSVLVYDSATGLLIKNGQSWPSVHSRCRQLLVNNDGSIDIWFGPQAPEGKENNWVQTIPGKEWYMILNLYDLPGKENNRVWKPGKPENISFIHLI